MIHSDYIVSQFSLKKIWMFSVSESLRYSLYFFDGHIGCKSKIVSNQIITHIDQFLIHIKGSIIYKYTIRACFRHFLSIGSDKEIESHNILFWKTKRVHECPSSEEIEILIIASKFEITTSIFSCDSNTIVSLHDRIKKFLKGNTFSFLISLGEIISIQHLSHRKIRSKFTHSCKIHSIKPLTIIVNMDLRNIDHF